MSYMQTIDSNAMSWDYSNTLIGRLGIEVDNNVSLHSVFDYKGLKIENHRYFSNVKVSIRMRRFESICASPYINMAPQSSEALISKSPI